MSIKVSLTPRKCLISRHRQLASQLKTARYIPDPLFIRKGQGVTPTAYATHLHEYISQGLESILGALDLTGNTQQEPSPSPPLRYGRAGHAGDHQALRSAFPRSCCTTSPLPMPRQLTSARSIC
jgi:hypothetical protein